MRILIAESDRPLGMFLKQGLETDGHEVEWLPNGEAAAAAFSAHQHDLVVLDLTPLDVKAPKSDSPNFESPNLDSPNLDLPRLDLRKKDGLDVLRYIRSINEDVPVLMLSARQSVEDKVRCLDSGADDCMIKPLSVQELRARCRALLRRRRESSLVLRCEGVELNRVNHTVECEGRTVPLTNKEFALLEYLMMHPGSCISRADLLEQVWNHETPSDTNVVDVYINYLRRKLGNAKASSMIQTVRGQGYCVGGSPPETYPAPRADA